MHVAVSLIQRWSFIVSLVLSIIVSAPLSGWLADAKFGNYKVFRVGAVLLFISTVMNCLFMILVELVWEDNHAETVLKWMHLCLVGSLFAVGGCACFVTALPLGLDQMPDASSSSITSYIAWFVCICFFGGFLYEILHYFPKNGSTNLVLALISAVCVGMVLLFNFLFSPKWLIIEPKSPQSLKTIYQVLKFAAKHKAAINRSALTYWEEDIPSRMDLGKSKYGGPFTTEQVEDVKTVLRLLTISLPLFFVAFSITFRSYDSYTPLYINFFPQNIRHIFVYIIPLLFAILATPVFEFVVYPLTTNKLPSILRRIAAVPLTLTFVSFVCLCLMLAHYLSNAHEAITYWIVDALYQPVSGILFQVSLTSFIEFVCAQSPYHMRGLLGSFVASLTLVSIVCGWNIGTVQKQVCSTQAWCPLISFSVKTLTCFVGFLLFCVVAQWYKMRVRDEDYSPQRVVEEVYARYLTAAAAQSRSVNYGTSN